MTKAVDRRALRGATSIAESNTGGIAAGTEVLTLDGALPVEFLNAGDRVITRAGMRVLRSVTVREAETEMYLVRPGALGEDQPGEDTLVPAGQMMLLRDWRAQALFGAERALVAVERLADGVYISQVEAATRCYHLQFDEDEVIYAGGMEVAMPAQQNVSA
ncbi:hypothetical protein ACMU_17960 [Actibacterium mucosum KCTC 23349]|uniref:Hedgehog/Intein (Hint) domain-containing protein n=1 Tax=Actibacterium mucosum KCTC 23349 TaxID=1454373 RepID=A0A037ZEM3_9RHOB|nr:Hint domain-containing protein [Actibacterium mucosum]KAJ54592.1 hypothetical protein ACMU_17960 [Actibacterium mucosum KCTC 23349]